MSYKAITVVVALILSRLALVSTDCICYLVDIDECSEANGCSVNSNCTNTNGSYTCECHDGFTLLADRRTCQGTLFLSVNNKYL